jgi:glutathione-independent formaldehyde dehydrogenase
MTLNNLVKSVRATGGLGIVGVFTKDPKSPDKLLHEGEVAFDVATYFEKGLTTGSGQCDVKRYNRRLRELIHLDDARPSFIVSHELALDEAPDAYQHFDAREHGWTKVVLHPGARSARQPSAGEATSQEKKRRPSRPTAAVA